MAGLVQRDKVGFNFTIPLTQDISLAGSARVNHGDFRRRFTGNLHNLATGHAFFDILNNWLCELIFGAVIGRTPCQHG